MKSIVSPAVFVILPTYIRGVVIGKNIDNHGENERLVKLLRQVEEDATKNAALQEIKSHPRIASWREAYAKFGINPNKYYSSIESLCRRARRGDQLAYINTAVALFNYFSLKHIVPSGGDDLASVNGDLRLTIAKGDEPFTPFNADTVEHPVAGEVVYVDNAIVMCRCLNWRQGNQTKLSPDTKDIAINIDCLPPFTKDEANTITAELAQLLKEFCGGDVKYSLLTPDHNEFEI